MNIINEILWILKSLLGSQNVCSYVSCHYTPPNGCVSLEILISGTDVAAQMTVLKTTVTTTVVVLM